MNSNSKIEELIKNDNYLNIYCFGSTVYGTRQANSDDDYICVVKEYIPSDDINIHHFTVAQFQQLLDNQDIQMLECYFLPQKYRLKEKYLFNYELDKGKLRIAISTITSNSWVKGKKKLIVTGDYDQWLAIKSVFHSLRILDYGIQIAVNGKIGDYSHMNYILTDLIKLSQTYDRIDLWQQIETKYRKTFNKLASLLKTHCPKNLIEKQSKKEDLINLFKENDCYSKKVMDSNLISQILELFEVY